MFKGKKILAIIPARAGSKRIKNKSLLKLYGEYSLLDFTYNSIENSKYISKSVLSSDSEKILKLGKKIGFKNNIIRPKKLASDKAVSEDVILHVLKKINEKFDIILLIQITSPLRTSKDIDTAIKKFVREKYDTLISISKTKIQKKFNVDIFKKKFLKKNFKSNKKKKFYYNINGAIYILNVEYFIKNKNFYSKNTGYYLMPYKRSLDIDTPQDLEKFKSYFVINKNIK